MTALAGMFSAEWLLDQRFPPVRYVVDQMVPEGMTILAAAPKVGKSWLVLGLGISIAHGQPALGSIRAEEPRPVLYFALEDGPRRLQSRLHALDVRAATSRLQFLTQAPREGVPAAATEFVQAHAGEAPVVIIDTLGKVAPPAEATETDYGRDYRVGSALKAISDRVPGSSVIVVHHTRKSSAADFLDAVSGTQGLAGSADTVLVLRRERMDRTATLSVTSRDAVEGEYGLRLENAGTWVLDGHDLEQAASAARDQRVSAGVGDRMAEVIATVGRFEEGIRPKELRVLLPQVAGLDEYLRRAVDAGRLVRASRGLYMPVRSVMSVRYADEVPHASHTSHTPVGEEREGVELDLPLSGSAPAAAERREPVAS